MLLEFSGPPSNDEPELFTMMTRWAQRSTTAASRSLSRDQGSSQITTCLIVFSWGRSDFGHTELWQNSSTSNTQTKTSRRRRDGRRMSNMRALVLVPNYRSLAAYLKGYCTCTQQPTPQQGARPKTPNARPVPRAPCKLYRDPTCGTRASCQGRALPVWLDHNAD